jgi:hypothetical protein
MESTAPKVARGMNCLVAATAAAAAAVAAASDTMGTGAQLDKAFLVDYENEKPLLEDSRCSDFS